jgi:hypothetical protein
MRKGVVVIVAVMLVCFPVLAGTYLMNDTGQTVYGLRVTFSEPVRITAFGDTLTKVDPTGQATQFTFSGGEVSTSGGEWFNWEPATAKVVSHGWLIRATEYRGVNMALEMANVSDLQYLKSEWNANLVRVCLFMAGEWGYFVPRPDAPTTFPDAHWERLDRFLNDCEANGIRVIIDLHQWLGYGYLNGASTSQIWRNAEYKNSFVEFWRLMAQRYSDRGEVIYGYELMNEPHASYGGQAFADEWHSLAQRAVIAIREYDQTHTIVIDCTDWGNPSGFNYLQPIDDEDVIYSFHMWLPHEFTHQGVNNSRTGVGYPTSTWDKEWIRSQLTPVLAFQRAHGVRIFAGEVGATALGDPAARAAYFRDCLELFEEYGFDYAQWCFMEWGTWSLEHAQTQFQGSDYAAYAGDTPALDVYLNFLARNRQPDILTAQARPTCLFDRPGEAGSWEYTVFGGDLLWRLNHAFHVMQNQGEITSVKLEDIHLLVVGSAREGYTTSEIAAIDTFVRRGGGLFYYGPGGPSSIIDWLASAGLGFRSGFVVSRPYEWDVGSYLCSTLVEHPITQDVVAFHTNWSAGLVATNGATILVWSPEESWIDLDQDRVKDGNEPSGPFGIMGIQEVGQGRVAVFADDSFNLTANHAITLGAALWLVGR